MAMSGRLEAQITPDKRLSYTWFLSNDKITMYILVLGRFYYFCAPQLMF